MLHLRRCCSSSSHRAVSAVGAAAVPCISSPTSSLISCFIFIISSLRLPLSSSPSRRPLFVCSPALVSLVEIALFLYKKFFFITAIHVVSPSRYFAVSLFVFSVYYKATILFYNLFSVITVSFVV
ncbi:hypothetical protein P8452_65004 [Trifolium repens]|nr:hypothetical protein P8452_65004 [Trifolium repens]